MIGAGVREAAVAEGRRLEGRLPALRSRPQAGLLTESIAGERQIGRTAVAVGDRGGHVAVGVAHTGRTPHLVFEEVTSGEWGIGGQALTTVDG